MMPTATLSTEPVPPRPPSTLWNLPNILTLSRLPLSVGLFWCIAAGWWWVALVVFALAAATDWLDGVVARGYGQTTAFGRNVDPLVDKVMIGGAYIFLLPVPGAELTPWMVTLVVARELLVTGLRGLVEATGQKFGADQLGKIKMVLQCLALAVILFQQALPSRAGEVIQLCLIAAMLVATAASGISYFVKAGRILGGG